jgi:hypothetical protein
MNKGWCVFYNNIEYGNSLTLWEAIKYPDNNKNTENISKIEQLHIF